MPNLERLISFKEGKLVFNIRRTPAALIDRRGGYAALEARVTQVRLALLRTAGTAMSGRVSEVLLVTCTMTNRMMILQPPLMKIPSVASPPSVPLI